MKKNNKTMNNYDFISEFWRSETRSEQFTEEALNAIFEHLEDVEEFDGREIEFDMIRICCEFTECNSDEELLSEFGHLIEGEEYFDTEDQIDSLLEALKYETIVLTTRRGYVIENF